MNIAFRLATIEATMGFVTVMEGQVVTPCGRCGETVLADRRGVFEGVICEVCTVDYLA